MTICVWYLDQICINIYIRLYNNFPPENVFNKTSDVEGGNTYKRVLKNFISGLFLNVKGINACADYKDTLCDFKLGESHLNISIMPNNTITENSHRQHNNIRTSK